MYLSLIKGSRLFLYLGFGFIVIALIVLPARMRVVTQPETPEIDLMWLGPIYAVLIGAWSLPSLLLGVIEFFKSKDAALLLIPILCFVNIFLTFMIWFQGRGWSDGLRFLLNYSPFIVPCVIADVIGLSYFTKGEKLVKVIKNPKVRMLLFIIVALFPFIIAGWVLYSWSMSL